MTEQSIATLRRRMHHAAFWAGIICVAIFAVIAGLVLRRYAWDQTEPIRYTLDIDNAFRQGTLALSKIGFLDRYDEQAVHPTGQFMDLDYAPGRLAIATLWTRWVRIKVDHWNGDPVTLKLWPQQFYTRARTLHQQYELCRPMLMINIAGELISAVALFLLVMRFTTGPPPRHRPWRAAILGLVAALFFWFDPALISNAHCWPQWDSWVLPFFLWAILLACWDCWFCSGAVIAAGAMFKGQILFGAPILILWPLFQGKIPAIARWISGLLFLTATCTAVWLVRVPAYVPLGKSLVHSYTNPNAIAWVIYAALIFTGLVALLWKRETRRLHLVYALVITLLVQALLLTHVSTRGAHFIWMGFAVALIFANWFHGRWTYQAIIPVAALGVAILLIYPLHTLATDNATPFPFYKLMTAILALALLLALTPRKSIAYTGAFWIALSLFMCIRIFGGSKGWFDYGIAYGTHHYEKMASGENNNLANLLKDKWAWDDLMAPVYTLPDGPLAIHIRHFVNQFSDWKPIYEPNDPVSLPLKYLLVTLWIISLILSSIGAAMHERARSPGFLAAIAAPWVAFFAVMAQMHQRYLLWGATLTSATAILSPGYAALHLLLSFISWTQELVGMVDDPYARGNQNQTFANSQFIQFINNWHPGIAWALLLTSAIYLYTAIKPPKKLIPHAGL